jgi:hypothetical protein
MRIGWEHSTRRARVCEYLTNVTSAYDEILPPTATAIDTLESESCRKNAMLMLVCLLHLTVYLSFRLSVLLSIYLSVGWTDLDLYGTSGGHNILFYLLMN